MRRRRKLREKITIGMQRKLGFTFVFFCILFVALLLRIMYIGTESGDRYSKIVLAQQEYQSQTIPYQRGNIVDQKGTVLASSVDVYNVILDCRALSADPDAVEPTMEALKTCFPEVSIDDARKRLQDNPDSQYQVLAKKVSYDEKKAFDDLSDSLSEDDTKNNEPVGVWLEKEYKRQYPYGSLAAQVIGFTSAGNSGTTGLELWYNDALNGVNGRSYGYINDDSDAEKTVIEPENGHTLVTSLDANIQSVVEKAITDVNALKEDTESQTGSAHTAAIVMNPKTGEIYAMASYPFFDLNDPRNLNGFYTEEQQNSMTDEQKLDALNMLWQNYPVTSTFEPGSTFKEFTVAAGLDSGTLKDTDTFVCDGAETFGSDVVHCWKREGHGTETLLGAIRDSCDDALMQMAMRIGPQNFAKYQALFGFGQKTGIDLPGEANTSGLLYSEAMLEKQPINLATNSFGQNFNVTMIQLASAFSSLVNGGKLYEPHLMTALKDDDGNVTEENRPTILKETVSPEVSAEVRKYLRAVVTEGTGTAAAVDGYSVSGKTGTAEKLPRGNGNYLVSFISATPAEDPEVVTYVVVDEPKVADQSTNHWALNITRQILTQILPYLNVPTTAEEEAEGITLY